MAGGRVRPGARVPGEQVEDDGPGHDRHPDGADRESDAELIEVAHDAIRRRQAERAAAGQQDGVRLLVEHARPERVGAQGARGPAAHVHAGHGAARHQHDRAAGAARLVGPVPDRHAAGQPARGLGVVRRHIRLLALAAGYAGTAAAAPGQ